MRLGDASNNSKCEGRAKNGVSVGSYLIKVIRSDQAPELNAATAATKFGVSGLDVRRCLLVMEVLCTDTNYI